MSDAESLATAHKRLMHNRSDLERSLACGCFYCLAIYHPKEIADWTDGDTTALCARCGIDSVLAAASGFPIEKDFLRAMKREWFGAGQPQNKTVG